MSIQFLSIAIALVVAQCTLPTRWAFAPLLIAGLHLGNTEFLPELTIARILISIGLIRALINGEFSFNPGRYKLDGLMLLFCGALVVSAIGHDGDEYIPSPFMARIGLVFNILGTYLYARAYVATRANLESMMRIALVAIVPLGILMLVEQRTQRNLYYSLGARSETSMVREDKTRAQGPFQHPILAGTAGATLVPFAFLAWARRRRIVAVIGAAGCVLVVLSSASSGPLAALGVSAFGMLAIRHRSLLPKVIAFLVTMAFLYTLLTGRGPWYLMASLDLVGGSTGWHRAYLIDQGFKHLGEWWLWGTDYTRHWMASGVRWNPNMIDITNYYLHLGVTGGLPTMLMLIAVVFISISSAFRICMQIPSTQNEDILMLWCVIVMIFAHAVSFISISYFDQMYIYFYIIIGSLPRILESISYDLNSSIFSTD